MGRRFQSKRSTVVGAVRATLDTYAPGARLPGVAELAGRHDVSTATAVYAMQVLVAEGLVTVVRGSTGGYFRTGVPTGRDPDRTAILTGLAADLEAGVAAIRLLADADVAHSGSLLMLLHEPLATALREAPAALFQDATDGHPPPLTVDLRRVVEFSIGGAGAAVVEVELEIVEAEVRVLSGADAEEPVGVRDVAITERARVRRARVPIAGIEIRSGRLVVGEVGPVGFVEG